MKLSTRVRYGLRAMIELTVKRSKQPVLVKSISENQVISKKYLENLLIALKNAGLVRSLRGAKGGYVLAKAPETVSIYDIVTALEGPITFIDCIGDPAICDRVSDCAMRDVWSKARDAFVAELRKVTLADLAERSHSNLKT